MNGGRDYRSPIEYRVLMQGYCSKRDLWIDVNTKYIMKGVESTTVIMMLKDGIETCLSETDVEDALGLGFTVDTNYMSV